MKVIDAVEEEKHYKGDTIIKQGESGTSFYLIEAGSCEVWLKRQEGQDPQMVHHYSSGDSFGELALLYDAPRAATVKVQHLPTNHINRQANCARNSLSLTHIIEEYLMPKIIVPFQKNRCFSNGRNKDFFLSNVVL